MSFRVLGTGMYVPPRVVTNDDLSQFLETNDEWITQRVGVKERHISTNETAADMGAKAARAALENSGVAAEEIDMILAASVSGVLCQRQGEEGARYRGRTSEPPAGLE